MNLLIIEDDKDILAFLESSLRREGFVVDTAGDGDAGCRKALGNDYDVVILDLALPHKGGREVCRELRQAGKQMPVLILSVKNEAETKVELFDMGADDYVVKPFSYSEILARIRVLMRRPRELRGDILRIADLTLDTRQRKLTCGTKDIHLTPKEFFFARTSHAQPWQRPVTRQPVGACVGHER